jgi:NADH-quinone oxidoreductase subunit A
MTALAGYMVLFVIVGIGFILIHLLVGKLVRPAKPDPEKMTIYECGEPTIGSSWVQFDLRFYVVALLFVIFDVEVAFFFPWAVVFGKLNALADPRLTTADAGQASNERLALIRALDPEAPTDATLSAEVAASQARTANQLAWIAFVDIVVFFGVLLVGFAYLWRRGDLDWVRSTAAERARQDLGARPPPYARPPLVGAGRDG